MLIQISLTVNFIRKNLILLADVAFIVKSTELRNPCQSLVFYDFAEFYKIRFYILNDLLK